MTALDHARQEWEHGMLFIKAGQKVTRQRLSVGALTSFTDLRRMCAWQWHLRAQPRSGMSACTGERMALNIFEPRYRLLVRRCMAGSRRFGMACIDYNNVLHEDACEAEIVECQPQPDG